MGIVIREAGEGDYKNLMKLYDEFVEEDRYSTGKEDSFQEVLASTENFIRLCSKGPSSARRSQWSAARGACAAAFGSAI